MKQWNQCTCTKNKYYPQQQEGMCCFSKNSPLHSTHFCQCSMTFSMLLHCKSNVFFCNLYSQLPGLPWCYYNAISSRYHWRSRPSVNLKWWWGEWGWASQHYFWIGADIMYAVRSCTVLKDDVFTHGTLVTMWHLVFVVYECTDKNLWSPLWAENQWVYSYISWYPMTFLAKGTVLAFFGGVMWCHTTLHC